MSERFDAIVIGGGTNGLVAATALAKAGSKVVLVERTDAPGGILRRYEFAPGYRVDPFGHDGGWLAKPVLQAAGLAGDFHRQSETTVVTPAGSGWLSLSRDIGKSVEAIRRVSPRDAERWPAFADRIFQLAGFLGEVYQQQPPAIDSSALGDLFSALGLARKLKGLGSENMVELLRTVPMSIQELLDDWFEHDGLKGALGAAGITDIMQGPRSGGTSFVFLHHHVGAALGALRGRGWLTSGPALTDALADAAKRAGVIVRTGVAVARIAVKDDAVTGVVLASGEEIAARAVISTLDPTTSLLRLTDPVHLDPEFIEAVRHIKYRGVAGKVFFALDGVPADAGWPENFAQFTGLVSVSPSLDYLEKAYDATKYGQISEAPYVEAAVATARGTAEAPSGKVVVSARVQYAPYKMRAGSWDAGQQQRLGDLTQATLDRHLPGFSSRVVARGVLSPDDLATRFGFPEGAASHGELTLDQILFMRPVAGRGRYRMPIDGLYLGGVGTHPGPGIVGMSGHLAARAVLADLK